MQYLWVSIRARKLYSRNKRVFRRLSKFPFPAVRVIWENKRVCEAGGQPNLKFLNLALCSFCSLAHGGGSCCLGDSSIFQLWDGSNCRVPPLTLLNDWRSKCYNIAVKDMIKEHRVDRKSNRCYDSPGFIAHQVFFLKQGPSPINTQGRTYVLTYVLVNSNRVNYWFE